MNFKRHYLVPGLVIGIVLSLKTSPAFAMGFGFGGFMGGLGGLYMIFFWVLVLTGALFLVKVFLQASGMNQEKGRTKPQSLRGPQRPLRQVRLTK